MDQCRARMGVNGNIKDQDSESISERALWLRCNRSLIVPGPRGENIITLQEQLSTSHLEMGMEPLTKVGGV